VKLFGRKPKNYGENRWIVDVVGGRCVLDGKELAGFIASRMVEAESSEQAWELGRQAVLEEFAQTGVTCAEESIRARSASPLAPEEKGPKKLETFFWAENDLPTEDFDKFEAWLRQFDVWVERDGLRITVRNNIQGQFDVSLEFDDSFELTVEAGPWHGHFEEFEQASACFRWLLTPYYRVVEEKKDGQQVGCWIERYQAEGWHHMQPLLSMDCMGLIEMGGPYELIYMQQALLDPGDYTKVIRGVALDDERMPLGSHLGTHTERVPRSRVAELGLTRGL
jgi:hypothetical protein